MSVGWPIVVVAELLDATGGELSVEISSAVVGVSSGPNNDSRPRSVSVPVPVSASVPTVSPSTCGVSSGPNNDSRPRSVSVPFPVSASVSTVSPSTCGGCHRDLIMTQD